MLDEVVSGFGAPYDESIIAFVDIFNAAISAAGISSEDDALAALLSGFSMKLRQIADDTADIGEVKDAVEDLGYAIFDVLLQQQDNDKIILIVRSGIISIFELTAEDFAGTDIAPPTEGEVEDEDDDMEDDITPDDAAVAAAIAAAIAASEDDGATVAAITAAITTARAEEGDKAPFRVVSFKRAAGSRRRS